MTNVSVIITVHNADPEPIIEQAYSQTKQPYEVIVFFSDTERPRAREGLKTIERPNLEDWGHDKRACGVELATGTYLTFWNHDDEYDPLFIEKMSDQRHDLIYCDFTSHLFGGATVNSKPELGKITSGNFLIDTELAKRVGYNHREYKADWLFIRDVMEANPSTRHVPIVLYKHR